MVNGKRVREKGKLKLGRYFQDLRKGERVSVDREGSMPLNAPSRLQGRTGVVDVKRGGAYLVKIKDQAQEKRFLIKPIHLKRV